MDHLHHLWSENSWTSYPSKQLPDYSHPIELSNTVNYLNKQVAFLDYDQINQTINRLSFIHQNDNYFIVHCGDCAEPFDDAQFNISVEKYLLVEKLALYLAMQVKDLHCQTIFRYAGQFAKPRSLAHQRLSNSIIPNYRGDLVHSFKKDHSSRIPDPQRLIQGYHLASIVYGDLQRCHNQCTTEILLTELYNEATQYSGETNHKINQIFANKIPNHIDSDSLLDDYHNDNTNAQGLFPSPLIISHEALHLYYEGALTKTLNNTMDNKNNNLDDHIKYDHQQRQKYYNLGAHLLWLGERTRFYNSAHVEYLKGIENPIAIKIGPTIVDQDLKYFLRKLNPYKHYGKLMIITRLGAKLVNKILAPLIKQYIESDIPAMWICDPMHGNTYINYKSQAKTRYISDIISELSSTERILKDHGLSLKGVHLEVTYREVLECQSAPKHYHGGQSKYLSLCDPRLNISQSLEVMDHLSSLLN